MKKYPLTSFLNHAALVFLATACVAAALFTFYFSVGKSFSLDETDLATRANMINIAGPLGPEIYFGKGNGEALPHPPMYDYTLALLFRCFGGTEAAGRGFGIFCYVLVGILMVLTLNLLLEDEKLFLKNLTIFFALGLYLVNPLILQHALLIDADSTYTFLFVNLFLYIFVLSEKKRPQMFFAPRIELAFVFALICLSKEGTPFLTAAGVLMYRAFNREWKKMAADLFLVFVLGVVIAWSAWLLFCHFTGIDPMIFLKQQYLFRMLKVGRVKFLMTILSDIPVRLRWPFFWVSPTFFILLTVCAWKRVTAFLSSRKLELSDVCFFIGGVVWSFYLVLRPSIDMMKYQHPVYPVLIIGMACVAARLFSGDLPEARRLFQEGKRPFFCFIFLMGLVCFYYYKLGDCVDYLIYPSHDLRWLRFKAAYWRPVLWVFGSVSVIALTRIKYLSRALVLTCLFFMFPMNFALDLSQAAPYTTAESWLNYGESGLKETARYLSTRLTPTTPCVLRKDIVYYLKFHHGIDLKMNRDPIYLFRGRPLREAVEEYLRSAPPSYVVLDPVVMLSNPLIDALGSKVFRDYAKDKRIGSFTILRRLDRSRQRIAP